MTRLQASAAYRAAMQRHTGFPVPQRVVARYEAALLRAARQAGALKPWPKWRKWR